MRGVICRERDTASLPSTADQSHSAIGITETLPVFSNTPNRTSAGSAKPAAGKDDRATTLVVRQVLVVAKVAQVKRRPEIQPPFLTNTASIRT